MEPLWMIVPVLGSVVFMVTTVLVRNNNKEE